MKSLVIATVLMMAGLTGFTLYYAAPSGVRTIAPRVHIEIGEIPAKVAVRIEQPDTEPDSSLGATAAAPPSGSREPSSEAAATATTSTAAGSNGQVPRQAPPGLAISNYGITVSIPPDDGDADSGGVPITPPIPVAAQRGN